MEVVHVIERQRVHRDRTNHPDAPLTYPATAAALTSELITTVLRERGVLRQALVSDFEITPVGKDSRVHEGLVRLRFHYDQAEPGAPDTAICKFLVNPAHGMEDWQREYSFYT